MKNSERVRIPPRSGDGASLTQAPALERLIAGLAANFVNLSPDAVDFTLLHGFKLVLRFFQLDRMALWEFSVNQTDFVLEQSRATTDRTVSQSRTDAKYFRWALDNLLRAEPIVIADVKDLPEAKHEVKGYFEEQGIRSWLAVPLRSQGAVFGALVFASIYKEVVWNDKLIGRLQMIADILGSALGQSRAEQALRQSELLKNSILSSIESSVAVIDRHGLIIATNTKWEQLATSKNASTLAQGGNGANYLEICRAGMNDSEPEVQQAWDGIQSVLNGSRARLELEYPSGSPSEPRWFQMTVTPLAAPGGGAVITHADITKQKQIEAQMRESEERFRKMADEVPVVIWMHGPDKRLIYVNKAGLEYSGFKEGDYLGRRWPDPIHLKDAARGLSTYEKAFAERQKFVFEYRHLHVSGRYRWLLHCGMPRYLSDGTFAGYIGVSVDIHDRKEAEQTRAEFTGRLLNAHEEERSRIGRELHDDFAQRLALLTMKLQQLEQVAAEPNRRERIGELGKQTKQLSVDLAQLSHRLHPSYLENLGLAAAVRKQCAETSQLHQLEIRCDIRDLPPFVDKDIALGLYRVLQEALHNIVKHSHASKVEAALFADAMEIRLRVSDNGEGFDQSSPTFSEGLGLISMRERLQLVGGDLSIWSKPSIGTRLEARVPLAKASQRAIGRRLTDSQQQIAV